MHREQSPARVRVRVECPATPKKPRLELGEFHTPCVRAKELPAVSDVSTACPSSSGFPELDFGFGAAQQHSGIGSVEDSMPDLDNLPMPSDFEAFKALFGSGPADKTITDCKAPSIFDEGPPGSNMMHHRMAPRPDTCPRTPCGTATLATDARVPTVPHPHTAPCLLKALQQNDLDALMAALTEDPDSASMPFMEHNMESPVCAAVRLCCPAVMISVLLEHGADPEADDMWGNTAMQHLQRQKRSTASSTEYVLEVEELLLKQGAKHGNSEPSVDELMLQGTLAQWHKMRFGPTQPSEVFGGSRGAPQLPCEWDLLFTSEQVEDLINLASWSRSEPFNRKHMAGAIGSI